MAVPGALAALDATAAGLDDAAVAARQAQYGPNEVGTHKGISPWKILLGQLKNVLILVLLVATAASAALGHVLEAAVITAIVVLAVVFGFVQEYRAERAIESLRKMAAPAANVLRSGQERRVPARDVVPGDVLVLKAGDRIAADARLLEASNLRVDEAPLTGESNAVDKRVDTTLPPEAPVGDRVNMVHAGTTIVSGRAQAIVSATGMDTEFGHIAKLLDSVVTTQTPLQKNLDRVGRQLAGAALVIVAGVVALGLWRGQPLIDMVMFGIALAVAVVPEALPAVVTIALALGVQRMVKRKALMRRLPAVETLGSTTIIGSDKTGTLTRDEMTAREVYVAGETWNVDGAGYTPVGEFRRAGVETPVSPALTRVLTAGVLVNDATLQEDAATHRWEMKGDPTEGALVVVARKGGLDKVVIDAARPRVDELPFTAETRRMTTFHGGAGGPFAFVKGAPEVMFDACTTWLGPEGPAPLTPEIRARLDAEAESMASRALRVLALAEQPDGTRDTVGAGLLLLGLVGLIDPPRDEAAEAIRTCRAAGIRAIMITGDHPATARAVAKELGLLEHDVVMTGAELDTLDDAKLDAAVQNVEVYARVSPAHKLRVVEALQRCGHVVAMTGDGVNDAPALKKADIGVAMGIGGTDVSREAAAMTLLDDNFATIVAAVEEGRRIFENIRKFLMYLLASNIGEIGLMAAAAIVGLPMPLSAVQILYVNLATDGLPALALAVDPTEPDLMQRPPLDTKKGIFSRPVLALMLVGGLWSSLATFGLFAWSIESGRTQAEAMTMTFACLVLIQFVQAYNYRSYHKSVFHLPFANKWLNLAVLAELAVLILLLEVPALRPAFGTTAVTWTDRAVVLACAASIVPPLELTKWFVRRAARRVTPPTPPHAPTPTPTGS